MKWFIIFESNVIKKHFNVFEIVVKIKRILKKKQIALKNFQFNYINDEIVEIIFALKTNVLDLIIITQYLFRFCIIQLKNKIIIIEKCLIIDVTIIVAIIIFEKHNFLIEWCREETHIIKITIIVLCNNEHESI